MCQSGPIASCFRAAPLSAGRSLQSRAIFTPPEEPSLRGTYTPLPTIDYSREALKAVYPTRTEPSVEDRIADILKSGYQPPITLGSTLTAADMDPWNVPVALGSKVTFRSLGYGKHGDSD